MSIFARMMNSCALELAGNWRQMEWGICHVAPPFQCQLAEFGVILMALGPLVSNNVPRRNTMPLAMAQMIADQDMSDVLATRGAFPFQTAQLLQIP
jgi:hypothetical protein